MVTPGFTAGLGVLLCAGAGSLHPRPSGKPSVPCPGAGDFLDSLAHTRRFESGASSLRTSGLSDPEHSPGTSAPASLPPGPHSGSHVQGSPRSPARHGLQSCPGARTRLPVTVTELWGASPHPPGGAPQQPVRPRVPDLPLTAQDLVTDLGCQLRGKLVDRSGVESHGAVVFANGGSLLQRPPRRITGDASPCCPISQTAGDGSPPHTERTADGHAACALAAPGRTQRRSERTPKRACVWVQTPRGRRCARRRRGHWVDTGCEPGEPSAPCPRGAARSVRPPQAFCGPVSGLGATHPMTLPPSLLTIFDSPCPSQLGLP